MGSNPRRSPCRIARVGTDDVRTAAVRTRVPCQSAKKNVLSFDRTANRRAKLVLAQHRLILVARSEEITCIQRIVSEEFKERAVKAVRSTLDRGDDHTAPGPPVFSREAIRQNLELFESIHHGRIANVAALNVDGGNSIQLDLIEAIATSVDARRGQDVAPRSRRPLPAQGRLVRTLRVR